MQVYVVGGAVRDALLGLPVYDHDYVVVGATPSEMVAQGFLPVGRDFPVFLHPVSHEEYALARTERKSGPGYHGFVCYTSPQVTLEEDLSRRDFTVNAMAQDAQGNIIDPWGGRADVAARVLRHVGPAFVEDPVRILRAARFMARLPDFELAAETLALMRQMVEDGEVDHLVPERVWQELSRGLMTQHPSRMLQVLRACGALARLMPEIDALFGVAQDVRYHPEIDTGEHTMLVLDASAQAGFSLSVRFSALMHDVGKGLTLPENLPNHPRHELAGVEPVRELCQRLRVPVECRDLALLTVRYHGEIHRADRLSYDELVSLLEHVDAFRRPQRFELLLQACLADARGRTGYADSAYPQAERLRMVLAVTRDVDASALAAQYPPAQMASRLHSTRVGLLTDAGV